MEVVNAIGRRKAAVARVFVSEGTGVITINKRDLAVYFPSSILQYVVKQPLNKLGVAEKYDIKVNLDGGGFKGQAEALRLAIARALVKKPEILILDDSSSALDFATDAALRMAIGAMEDKPTLFIVSQRTSAIQYADQIVVLDDGNVVGLGTHEELMDSCEVYREIYESQYKKSK